MKFPDAFASTVVADLIVNESGPKPANSPFCAHAAPQE